MKRATVIFMTSVLAFGVLTGCGSSPMKNTVSDISSSNSSVSEQGGEVSVAETGETVKVTSVEGITFERPKDWEVVWEDDTFYEVHLPMGSMGSMSVSKSFGDLFDEADVNELAQELGDTVESTELVRINGVNCRKTVYIQSNGYKREEYMLCKNGLQISIHYIYSKEEGTTYEKEFTDLVKSLQFVDTVSEQSKEVSTIETGKTVKVTSVDGITFERPENWIVYDEDETSYTLAYASSQSSYGILVDYGVEENLSAYTLLKLANGFADGIDILTKSNEVTEITGVNGEYARKLVCEGVNEKGGVRYVIYYLIAKGDNLATAMYMCDVYNGAVADATLEKEFTDLVNSIQFVETVSEQSKEESSRTESSRTESSRTESSSMTMGQSNALKQAGSYLKYSSFSYDDLIEQLEFEGYSHSEAVFAADNCGADWNEQAVRTAKDYLNLFPLSYTGLIKYLESDKFTPEQAQYGADNCGADWYEQAVREAKECLEYSSFSRVRLIQELENDGYTSEQAEYAAKQVGY